MIKNIRKKLDKDANKVLVSNFFSLTILQGANFILPLLAVPYLIRVLGIELYGLLAFAMALIMYLMYLSDYGFNLTATREISVHRDSKENVIEIFSSVMTIKISLMILGFLLLSIIVFLFEKLQEDWQIYYITFGMVVGQVLFPVWFFQGMEKMKYISILNILAKIIFLIAIFIFVNEKEDYLLVPAFNSMGFIIAGIISLYYVNKEFGVSFKRQSNDIIIKYLKDGWHIFISRATVVMYTSSNIFILGMLTNNTLVGYYSIAEKIISASSSLASIFGQVLFPHLSKVWSINKVDYYKKFLKSFYVILSIMLLLSIFLYVLSPYIIKFLSGHEIPESVILLKILAVTVILSPLGGLFTQSFVTQQESKYVIKATFYTMIVNLLLVFFLIEQYNIYGLAITVLLVQIFQVFINTRYFLFLKRKNLCVA